MESAEEAEHLSNQWDWTLVPGFTASKILWLKSQEPDNFQRLRHVLLPHDFLNYHLTGRLVMEVSQLITCFLSWTQAHPETCHIYFETHATSNSTSWSDKTGSEHVQSRIH